MFDSFHKDEEKYGWFYRKMVGTVGGHKQWGSLKEKYKWKGLFFFFLSFNPKQGDTATRRKGVAETERES